MSCWLNVRVCEVWRKQDSRKIQIEVITEKNKPFNTKPQLLAVELCAVLVRCCERSLHFEASTLFIPPLRLSGYELAATSNSDDKREPCL